jgi:hypothetical protein
MTNENQNSNQPVHRIRLGSVGVAIFANQTNQGRTMYNAQFDRSYLQGEEWKHTKSFGRDDLLVLAKLADLTHTWITEQQRSDTIADEEEVPEAA